MRATLLIAILCLFSLHAAPAGAQAKDLKPLVDEAEAVMQELRDRMMAEMIKAMGQGPAEAIGVCRHLAPEIKAELEKRTGWTIRRVSSLPRTAENAPNAEEAAALKTFEVRLMAGQTFPNLRRVDTVAKNGEANVHVMQAIPTFDACLACHGSTIDPAIAKEIKALYPDDKAVGYKAGDLRGAFSLYKPVAAAPAAPVAARPTLASLGYAPQQRADLRGDPARGVPVFQANCASCHAAPDLAKHLFGGGKVDMTDKTCIFLETHGFTDKAQDCDIVAFLKDLSDHMEKRAAK